MNKITKENLQQYCRTCLTQLEQLPLHYVKTIEISDWIYNFTSIDVRNESQEYPQAVCRQCYHIFKDLYNFQQLVWQSEKTLAAILGNAENVGLLVAQQKLGLKRKIVKKVITKKRVIIYGQESSDENTNVSENSKTAIVSECVSKKANIDQSMKPADKEDDVVIKTEIMNSNYNKEHNKCSNTPQVESSSNVALQSLKNFINEGRNIEEVTDIEKNKEKNLSAVEPNSNEVIIIKTEEISDNENDNKDNLAVEKDLPVDVTHSTECSSDSSNSNIDAITQSLYEEIVISNSTTEEENQNLFNIEILDTDSNFDIKFIRDLEHSTTTDSTDELAEYSCEKCNLIYDNKYNCLAHKRLTHQRRKRKGFKCEICPKSYFTYYNLNRHLRERHKIFVRPYKCEYKQCNCRFQDWTARIRHYHEYHRQKKAVRINSSLEDLKYEKSLFICIVCNKQYKSLNYIKFHMPTHGDDLKFSCGICGVAHSSQKKLNYHYDKLHDSKYENMNRCKICQKLFKRKDEIEKHILLEHKRVFICQFCPRRYRTKYALIFHVQALHDKAKQFPCDRCEELCPSFDALRNHLHDVHCV